jgi:hypothetical protein
MKAEAMSSLDLSTESLFELLERKLHLLTAMREMSLAQTDLVSQHDMTSLMSLLSKKQELMASLAEVQSQFEPFREQDPETRDWSSQSRRNTCQEMVARCDQLLQELIVMEDRSLGSMSLQRDSIAAQLQQNIDASTIQNAYESTDNAMEESYLDSSLSIEG